MNKRFIEILLLLICIIFSFNLSGMSRHGADIDEESEEEETIEKIDDWVLGLHEEEDIYKSDSNAGTFKILDAAKFNKSIPLTLGKSSFDAERVSEANIGLSVGGAKDIDNFRDNIANNYLPLPSSITYEGLFYDYYFETGKQEESTEMFSPSYSIGKIDNIRSKKEELWLSVGLNSNIKGSDFARKKLNLVVVLDISGSMRSSFDEYYYDGKKNIDEEEFDKRSKLEIAKETICSMLDHLNDDDRFGMVVFENQAHLAKPLNSVGKTDMKKIKGHIMDLHTMGGTNMYAGMQEGTEIFKDLKNTDKTEYENRIIFLTDAMPNRDLTDKYSLWGVLKENAKEDLYATLIGVGVDFQTELVEAISKVEGANYYSIQSARDFKKRLDDEFEYMVTPLVFDLRLVLDTEGYRIKRVCGIPYSEDKHGEIMKVGTLFPSASEEGEVKGGIILVELEKLEEGGKLELIASYDDRSGKHHRSKKKVNINDKRPHSGMKKGILLVHYADLLKEWIHGELGIEKQWDEDSEDEWQYMQQQRHKTYNSQWEHGSIPLKIDGKYIDEFIKFREYMQKEITKLGDKSLQQEIDLLDKLIDFALPYDENKE